MGVLDVPTRCPYIPDNTGVMSLRGKSKIISIEKSANLKQE